MSNRKKKQKQKIQKKNKMLYLAKKKATEKQTMGLRILQRKLVWILKTPMTTLSTVVGKRTCPRHAGSTNLS
jgi:hypothetical protein